MNPELKTKWRIERREEENGKITFHAVPSLVGKWTDVFEKGNLKMPKMTSLLVGAHFHPPAKALLLALRPGQTLRLDPEPENPYDANAIRVLVDSHTIDPTFAPSAEVELNLAGMGFSWEDIMAEPSWWLGFISAQGNKQLAKLQAQGLNLVSNVEMLGMLAGESETKAKLGFGPSGEAFVSLSSN